MPKSTFAQVRCEPHEKKAWQSACGGERKFSAWARDLLNLAVGPKGLHGPKEPKRHREAAAVRLSSALDSITTGDAPNPFARLSGPKADLSKSQLKTK